MNQDLISRQAAIAAIKEWGLLDGLSEGQAIEILADEEKVPSAQPEHTETHSCDCERTETHESRREWYMHGYRDAQPRWIPVTLETLPNLNSVVVVCGKKGTWDYGTYRGWSGDIHSWQWKKNTIKHVYWWMYKADALPEQYEGEQDENN